MASLDVESVRATLAQPSASQAIRAFHQHCETLQQRKILLSTLFYPLFTHAMQRIVDNRARPCLLCCDLLAFELLTPPLPAVAATSTTPAKAPTEPGSLFSLLFRTASFPPLFIAPVRSMLPVPLQRLMRSMPVQHLPAFFRSRAVQGGGGGGGGGAAASNAPGGVEYLELTLYEYYFLSCANFLLQPDVHVQSSVLVPTGPRKPELDPPTPDAYNQAFLRLLTQYLEFFAPTRGNHSSTLKMEEKGWNVQSVMSHGWSLVEVMVEVLVGQFSYEAAQQPTALQSDAAAMQAASSAAAAHYGPSFNSFSAPLGPLAIPPDEFALPTAKVVNAIMRIVYHMLEMVYMESPATPAAVQAVTATRASILQWQSDKYSKHSESMMVKLRVDWHFFGMLQHCFHRWAGEWSTSVGVAPVQLVSFAAASQPSSTTLTSYSRAAPRTVEDRLTKLIELWLDYLEPWKSIYSEEFNPLIWRWWIVANLPFYTILLRDFLRMITQLDLGRDQTPTRTAHLKTVLHLLKIFEGPVLEHVEDVETLLFRGTATQQHFAAAGQRDQANQQTQQETFVVRNALLHLSGLRPESYIPVFASSAAKPASSPNPTTPGNQAFSFSATSTPVSANTASRFGFSPQSVSNASRMQQQQQQTPLQPGGQQHQQAPPRLLESQQISLQLIRLYSIGYTNAAAISSKRETDLLNAPSVSPAALAASAQQRGQTTAVQGISLLAQEEQLGQHIEKRLRQIFRLPEETSAAGRRDGAAGAAASTPRAGGGGVGAANAAPAPKNLRELEPEYVHVDRAAARSGLADSAAAAAAVDGCRLTPAGRLQVRRGLRLCSRFDVPVLETGEVIIGSDEVATIVRWALPASAWLNAALGLQARPKSKQVNLRFLANVYVLYTIGTMLAMIVFIIGYRRL